jgi:4-hydroxy-tetrahydrodipicolinate synthase
MTVDLPPLQPSQPAIVALRQAAVIPALPTFFKLSDEGLTVVDEVPFVALCHRLIAQGADALLVNGTTAESPTLSLAEKHQNIALAHQVRQAAKQASGTRVPLIAGIGGNDTRHAVEEAVAFAPRVDALLVVVPYYNKPSQAGLLEHFGAIAQAVPNTPLILYNIPGRCVVNLDTDTVVQLHQAHANIIGVKHCHPNLETLMALRAATPAESFTVWCGDDSLALPAVACGAVGLVSAVANVAMGPLKRLIAATKAGDWAVAHALNAAFLGPAQGFFALPNPTLLKACLAAQGDGAASSAMRLPLVPVSDDEQAMVHTLLAQLEQLHQVETDL